MKTAFKLTCLILLLGSISASAQRRDSNVQSNHSVSMQIMGLEYSYEQALRGNWSLIYRAGLVPNGIELYSYPESSSVYFNIGAALTVEPRIYTSMYRRFDMDRDTYLNSADFVSFRTQLLTSEDGAAIALTPMYGIRRATGIHWIHEFTFGTRLFIGEYCSLAPHIQYRIGFAF